MKLLEKTKSSMMRSKLRGGSSRVNSSGIYWGSEDSSGGSSGSRNYVDPWDLENYAYLRRHSIAAATQPIYQTTPRSSSHYGTTPRLPHLHSPIESDYWYAPSVSATREPGYDAPGSVEEIYFRPSATMPRPVSTAGCYYHPHSQLPVQQPIYEDELMMMSTHYPTMHNRHRRSTPLYDQHLFELEQAEALEELRTREMLMRQSKTARARNYSREECYYHKLPSEMLFTEATLARSRRRHMEELEVESAVDEVEVTTRYHQTLIKPSHITLNTYGHLKIDYTNSWNSLHRKIASK